MNENCYISTRFNNNYVEFVLVKLVNGKVHILESKKYPLAGYLDGSINNLDAFSESFSHAVNILTQQFNFTIDEMMVCLPPHYLKIYQAEVQNSIKTEGQIISENEIKKARNDCKNAKVNDDEVVVEESPIYYTLDDNSILRTAPINYASSTLSLKSYIYTIPLSFIESLFEVFQKLNIKLLAPYLNSFIPYELYVEPYESEEGLIIVDFSHDFINISLFYKEQLIDNQIINLGIQDLILEIQKNFNIDFETAENFLLAYFVPNIEKASDIIILNNYNLSEKRLSGIVLNKLIPIIEQINNICKNIVEKNNLNTIKKIVCGKITDIHEIEELFTDYKIGLLNKIGLIGNEFNDCLGCIYRYLHLNKDQISNIKEDDDKPSFTLKDEKENNETTSLNKSRFVDIFDE